MYFPFLYIHIYIYHPQITMFAGWSHFCWLKAIDNMMDVRDIYLNVYPYCILYHLYRIVHVYITYHLSYIMYHVSYIIYHTSSYHISSYHISSYHISSYHISSYLYLWNTSCNPADLRTSPVVRAGLHTDLPRWVHEGWGCHWVHPRHGKMGHDLLGHWGVQLLVSIGFLDPKIYPS